MHKTEICFSDSKQYSGSVLNIWQPGGDSRKTEVKFKELQFQESEKKRTLTLRGHVQTRNMR